jgi:hypothetical protein
LQVIRSATESSSHVPTELLKEKEKLQEEVKKYDANTIGITFVI